MTGKTMILGKTKTFNKILKSGICAATLFMAQQTTLHAETLQQAIAVAYQNNPTIQRARAQQRSNDENYIQVRSSLGPTLSVGTSTNYTNYNQAAPFGRNRSTTSASLSGSQLLFGSGGLSSSVDAAQANVLGGQAGLRSIEQRVMFNVINVYTAVRRDQEAVRISQESLNVFQKQFEETTARFEVGELTRTDVAQSQAKLAAARASFSARQAQLDSDRAVYTAIVGHAPSDLQDLPALAHLPTQYEVALDLASKNNPDLVSAFYNEEIAKYRVKTAQASRGPSLSLGGSYGGSNPTSNLGGLQVNTASAVLNLIMPLFTSGENASRVRQAGENLNVQKMTVEIARRQVIQDVSQAWADLISSRSSAESNTQQVKSAAIAAEGVRYEAQAGLRTTIEVLNAQLEYENAQLALVEAQRNEYIAQSQLLVATGQLSVNDFAPEVPLYDPNVNFAKRKKSGPTLVFDMIRGLDAGISSLFSAETYKK